MDASTRTTLSRLLVVILLTASLAAAQGPAFPAGRLRSPHRPSARAQVSLCADECTRWERSFAIDSVRDLNIVVTWTSWLTPGTHVQRLELLSPAGDPYQQIDTSFDSRTAWRNRLQQSTLRSSLPIAGSWIQQHKVSGNWTLNLYLDGQLISSTSLKLE